MYQIIDIYTDDPDALWGLRCRDEAMQKLVEKMGLESTDPALYRDVSRPADEYFHDLKDESIYLARGMNSKKLRELSMIVSVVNQPDRDATIRVDYFEGDKKFGNSEFKVSEYLSCRDKYDARRAQMGEEFYRIAKQAYMQPVVAMAARGLKTEILGFDRRGVTSLENWLMSALMKPIAVYSDPNFDPNTPFEITDDMLPPAAK